MRDRETDPGTPGNAERPRDHGRRRDWRRLRAHLPRNATQAVRLAKRRGRKSYTFHLRLAANECPLPPLLLASQGSRTGLFTPAKLTQDLPRSFVSVFSPQHREGLRPAAGTTLPGVLRGTERQARGAQGAPGDSGPRGHASCSSGFASPAARGVSGVSGVDAHAGAGRGARGAAGGKRSRGGGGWDSRSGGAVGRRSHGRPGAGGE
jgi:hypothetical protein